jgi:proteasome accessory factor C
MIAAEAHTPLERVRKKLEETFGEFELAQGPEPQEGSEEELIGTFQTAIEGRWLVEIEYLKEGEDEPYSRLVEPYRFMRELPVWRVHTWDRTVDGPRTYRLDRMRSARLTAERFERRADFDPNYLSSALVAKVWYSRELARWQVERDPRRVRSLEDGAALGDEAVGSPDWLVGEVLSLRGEAVVLEPQDLRKRISARARELARELGVSRLRVAT